MKKKTRREILPDYVYGSVLVAKLINKLMLDGKKVVAEKILYGALERILEAMKNGKIEVKTDNQEKFNIANMMKNQSVLIEFLIEKVAPTVQVTTKRVGGANYQIPSAISTKKAFSFAIKWIVLAVRNRPEKTAINRLYAEIIDIFNDKGEAIKKKQDIHKLAESNRAFAHFAKLSF